jgi:hypothetical protein
MQASCNKQQHFNLARKQSKKKQSHPAARMQAVMFHSKFEYQQSVSVQPLPPSFTLPPSIQNAP